MVCGATHEIDFLISSKTVLHPEMATPEFNRINLDDESWVDQCINLPTQAKFDGPAFEQLWSIHPEEFGRVKIYGKELSTPRWQQSYLKPYWFSGMTHAPLPLPEEIQGLFDWVKTINPDINQCLINWYQDGNHYIGPHSDDETQLVPGSDIFSFSYGAERQFHIHPKNGPSTGAIHKIPMPHNSLLIMRGKMQRNYKHSVPKSARVNNRRINITFRCFK